MKQFVIKQMGRLEVSVERAFIVELPDTIDSGQLPDLLYEAAEDGMPDVPWTVIHYEDGVLASVRADTGSLVDIETEVCNSPLSLSEGLHVVKFGPSITLPEAT